MWTNSFPSWKLHSGKYKDNNNTYFLRENHAKEVEEKIKKSSLQAQTKIIETIDLTSNLGIENEEKKIAAEEEILYQRKKALEDAKQQRKEQEESFAPLLNLLKERNINLTEFASFLQK